MANVYYKFNSELSFSHVGFDGLHISVVDLKKAILHQKRLGKTADFDLLISNAQTKEEYVEDNCLIPKNTSVIVARVPVSNQYNKKWESLQSAANDLRNASEPTASASAENVDLSKMNGSEEDKIQAMMVQSTLDYDPASYQRVRGSTSQVGEVPQNYRCHRCHKAGHWIKNCPMNPSKDHFHSKVRPENKKMTGIPRSLRDNPPSKEPTEQQHKIIEQKLEPPEDLLCSICKGIFKDAVMIPCCGSSFCDECIRTALLETDDNECPECAEKGTSPGSLIPNRFLRTNVAAFLSDSNANVGREKNSESHEENVVESSPFKDDIKEVDDVEEQLDVVKKEIETPSNEHEETPENKNIDKKEQNETTDDDDEDEDDDNIVVTVPPASAAYKETFRVSQQARMKELSERQNVLEESHGNENLQHASGQFSDNYYYPEHFNDQHGAQQHAPFSPDDTEKNYMATIPSTNNNQASYLPRNMYNQQQAPTSQMPIRPAMYGQQQQQYQQQQPPPFYPQQQQNMRPYRFEHRGDYQQPMRHHHHQGHHYQHHYSMPASGHENFGMRYQRPMHNLANIVSQNIQQRFGTGVIEDPLEAFNKMMREKEMRKDRFKRSPVRFNENRGRSPLRKYSPEIRHKSPHRRRKRTRSFSSNSSRSRSRSRSFDRHHNKDYRRKYRGTEKNKQFDNRRSKNRKSFSPDAKKANHDAFKSGPILQEEIRPSVDEIKNYSNDLSSNQPPPPGEEVCEEEQQQQQHHEGMTDFIQNIGVKEPGEKSPSSEETKHGKKTRDRKKHKKSETKSKKKKKRDRREKRSQSNTPGDGENNKGNNEALIEESEKTDLPCEQVETTTANASSGANEDENAFRPELSKWEKDDQPLDKCDDDHEKDEPSKENENVLNFEEKSDFEVTTEIIKRAENLIFSKSSNVPRHNHEKVSDKSKDSSPLLSVIKKVDIEKKYDSFQVTVPVESGTRSVELKVAPQVTTTKSSKKEPTRTSIKERLGKKVSERSKSRSREKDTNNSSSSSRVRKLDNRKHVSSYINSAPSSSSKSESTRTRERTVRRRSRSHNRVDSGSKRHQRSKSRNSKDNEGQRDRNHKSKNSLELHSNKKEQKNNKRRSDSPRSDGGHERKKLRSSSTESKRQKKKKKKEKKAKKKSRDRK